MTDPLYSFEAEHIFAQELFKDETETKALLEKHGYSKDMMGNLIGLYSDPDVVDQIQALPDSNPWKQVLLDKGSAFGITWHKGGPTSKDGQPTGNGGFKRDGIVVRGTL